MVEENIFLGNLFYDDLYLLCVISIFCDFCNWELSQILHNIEKTWVSLSTSFTPVFVSLNSESMVKGSIQLI